MDHSQYLTSMGITLCRRALFSYTSQPQGSYGLHVIFRKFVKEKKILMHDRDRDNWCAFLSDYIVFRICDTGQRKWTISTISSMPFRPKWKKSRWNGISG